MIIHFQLTERKLKMKLNIINVTRNVIWTYKIFFVVE